MRFRTVTRPGFVLAVLAMGCSTNSPASDLGVVPDLAQAPDLAGCPSGKPPAATITVKDDFYSPQEVTIPVCGKVRWVFTASGQHGVFPWDMGFPDSPVMAMGTYEYVFPKAGVFDYGCAIHGRNMPGKVTVQ